jgi:septal ring-binding cell division protein DamX
MPVWLERIFMRRFSSLRHSLLGGLVAVVALAATPWASWAQSEAADNYAILIVGDESNAELLRREKVLIQEMAKNIKKQQKLPIYSYHFNKERERTYCEKKLGVLREDLLFVGIVALTDKVPRKIEYRLDRIVSPARAAKDIVTRAEELTAEEAPQVSPSPSQTPELTPSPSPSPGGEVAPGMSAGRFRVQLGVFTQQKFAQDLVDQLKAKGYEARFEKVTSDAKESFKVWVGSFQTKEDAQQANTELQADGFEKGFIVEAR